MKQKILTRNQVSELGLDKVSVITADMLEGYTSIGEVAFWGCSGLASVTIPNSVTCIGEGAFSCCGNGAFSGCISLTSINVASDNSNYCSVDGVLFNKDKRTLIQYPGGKQGAYIIPDSVTNIGDYAFRECSGLTSIVIPNSVTSIGDSAFSRCSGLTSIVIPDSVTGVGEYTFSRCSGLTSIVIPNSVTSIGDLAFQNCTGLTSVTIPNSVTSIGIEAFSGCSGLDSVTIGDKTYKKQAVTNGKSKAYKGFNADMTCRDFQYEEGKTYEYEGEPILCVCGFHASLKLSDVFNYYNGEFGKDVVVYEVELEGVDDERNEFDSKVVAKKITIGKRIL